jgi:hypothetical protein
MSDQSVLSVAVRIIDKLYHSTTNPDAVRPLRWQHEDY